MLNYYKNYIVYTITSSGFGTVKNAVTKVAIWFFIVSIILLDYALLYRPRNKITLGEAYINWALERENLLLL